MSLTTSLLFVAGLLLLLAGAELLVRGAVRLAVAAKLPPLVIGLTVVAFGTSAPELAVTVGSALAGQSDLGLGNVVGSNIFNVLAVLGVAALLVPLRAQSRLVRLDVPLMIVASLIALLLALDGRLGRLDGSLLLAAGLGYTAFLVRQGRREGADAAAADSAGGAPAAGAGGIALAVVLAVAGLALLVLGARWLVDGAVAMARTLGVSELVIGLTIVAAGTSLPEAATSIVAGLRGQRDIAVGNVVGSNIFNLLWVLGAGAVAGGGIAVSPAALRFDLPVAVAVAVACLPVFFTGGEISRWEGGLFTGYYLAYVAYLVLAASGNTLLPAFAVAMLGFALPLTAVTLAVLALRQRRRDGRRDRAQPGSAEGGRSSR